MDEEDNELDEEEAMQEEIPKKPEQEYQQGESVFCKHCQKTVIPVFKKNRWHCPDCNLYVPTPKSAKPTPQTKEIGGARGDYRISSQRPISLSGKETATAEVLINAGLANNFNDLVRKGIDIMYRSSNLPFNPQMEINSEKERNPDPKRTMKELQEQKMMETYIEGMKRNPSSTLKELQEQKLIEAYIKNMGKDNQQDPLQFMMLMRMMENMGTGKDSKDNNFMDKILQLQMIKSLGGGETNSQREIADLKQQMATQQLLQQVQQKGAPNLQDQMLALEKIRADRDTRVREAELETQKQRDETLKIAMDSKLKELERSVEEARQSGGQLGTQRIRELKDEIAAIKEISTEIGAREKGTGEMVMEGIGNVAGQLGPALAELVKQKRQSPPVQPPPPAEQPPEPLPPQSNPEPNPFGLTETEQEMADQNAEMYIYDKKKK